MNPLSIMRKKDSIKAVLDARRLNSHTDDSLELLKLEPLEPLKTKPARVRRLKIDNYSMREKYFPSYVKNSKVTSVISIWRYSVPLSVIRYWGGPKFVIQWWFFQVYSVVGIFWRLNSDIKIPKIINFTDCTVFLQRQRSMDLWYPKRYHG